MKNLNEVYKHKNSDIAVLFDNGASINKITADEWKKIQQCDVWVKNFFVYHPLIPDFYHLEMKSGRVDWQDLWMRKRQEKGDRYDEVAFIIWARKDLDYLVRMVGEEKHVYGYERRIGRCNPKEDLHPTVITHNCNASITLMLELLKRFDYEKIIIFGLDLYHSRYFWTDRLEYGETHINTNAGHRHEEPHSIAERATKFIIEYNRYQMGERLFVGYKDTLLYPKIPFIDIRGI